MDSVTRTLYLNVARHLTGRDVKVTTHNFDVYLKSNELGCCYRSAAGPVIVMRPDLPAQTELDVFLHEAGHATFSSLQIPLFGRQEDAADQFSTYMMLRFDKAEARRLILGSAYQYKGDLASPTITVKQQNFADEHGTPAQRFFNLLCTAYGSDPKLFADVVAKGFLPEDRAVGCEREYIQLSHAFRTLIGPHIDGKLARKLHKRWLPPATTKPRTWPTAE